jgi:hypothetical protein
MWWQRASVAGLPLPKWGMAGAELSPTEGTAGLSSDLSEEAIFFSAIIAIFCIKINVNL